MFLATSRLSAETNTWVEDSFTDFADGRLDGGGQNLYVSHDGHVRTIHRFDLNDDGYIDLIFNSTHDSRFFVPATAGFVDVNRRAMTSELTVEGSKRIVLADLNGDDYPEAVFCPNYSGLQNKRRFLPILWGGKDGWPARRSGSPLPVHDASDVAVCDLNADGHPDVATLNGEAWLPGQPSGNIIRIYWGSSEGYLRTRLKDFGVAEAHEIEAGDFDGDGHRDLVISQAGGHPTRVALLVSSSTPSEKGPRRVDTQVNNGEVRSLKVADLNGDEKVDLIFVSASSDLVYLTPSIVDSTRTVPAFPASHIECGDLDGDGHQDLVLTDFTIARAGGGEATGAAGQGGDTVRILWGAADGFSKERVRALTIPNASAAAIGDLDSDGHSDLVVAVYQGETTLKGESVLYFGSGGRELERAAHGFACEGATDVAIVQGTGLLPPRAVFANSLGGTLYEEVPLQLYWGGPDGFDPENVISIPFRSGYESSSADLNLDGFTDLIALNSQHGGALEDPYGGANIFWGSENGFDFEQRRTVVSERLLGTSNVADLNRDGYLDLIFGVFDQYEGQPIPLIIRYGSSEGFRQEDRVTIPSPGRSIGSICADFNKDEWLDIAVSSYYADRARIFWGSSQGFASERQTELAVVAPIGIETADLNGDDHLDLIVGSYRDPLTEGHDMGSTIFYGSADGFRHWEAQRLPGWAPVGHCVADFDADGFLDLFVPHYLGEKTRERIPAYLYWGSRDGFHPRRRTPLICDSSDDALAADFNRDGRLDLAVVCHSKDGSHYTDSLIFYNDGERFANPKITPLPTHGPHWMWLQDMGHIYHRRWEQAYESSVRKLERGYASGTLTYAADVPAGTRIGFAVRSAKTRPALNEKDWRALTDGSFHLNAADRHLQYRATLYSDNGDRYPVLDRVSVALSPQ